MRQWARVAALGLCAIALACKRDNPPSNNATSVLASNLVEAAATTDEVDTQTMVVIDAARLYKVMGPSVARIEFDGELYNGEQEHVTGSGFVLRTGGYVLTCKHVVPELSNYRNATINVRFRSKNAPAVLATVEWAAAELDLLVLKVASPTPPPIPLAHTLLEPGNDVMVLGFPADFDLNVTRGIVSGPANDHRYVMDATINWGNSGGPVFSSYGRAIGVAWGAALKWKLGSETVDLQGVRYFIPMANVIAALPAQFRPSGGNYSAVLSHALSSASEPLTLSRAETLEIVKDDHPVVVAPHKRRYEKIYEADAGFEIVGADATVMSANHASPIQVAVENGKAIVSVELTSGPAYDRWRGWLVATVALKQRATDVDGDR